MINSINHEVTNNKINENIEGKDDGSNNSKDNP